MTIYREQEDNPVFPFAWLFSPFNVCGLERFLFVSESFVGNAPSFYHLLALAAGPTWPGLCHSHAPTGHEVAMKPGHNSV